MHLTDEQWSLVQPLLPVPARKTYGRPFVSDRSALAGILWKLSTNLPWYDMPSGYPSYQTCYRRYLLWKRLGLLDPICQALIADLRDRGGLDIDAAVRNRLIRCRRGPDNRPHWIFPPELHGAWQQSVAMLYLNRLSKIILTLEKQRRSRYRGLF